MFLGERIEFRYLLVIPVVIMLIAADAPKILFSMFFVYAMSGPTLSLLRWRKRRLRNRQETAIRGNDE